METSQWDDVDRQLVHALVVAPRAPFKALADAIGVSDQTVARRFRKLEATARLRVHGVVNGPRAGWPDWIVRLQVAPGSADAIADALVRRTDTRWVRLVSGGTEIHCSLQARTAQQRDDLLLRGLPGSRRVVSITAQSLLHAFTRVEWSPLTRALTSEQLSRFETPIPNDRVQSPPHGEPVPLRPDDDALLSELARDGRATNSTLAAALHWHESTVRRRIEELLQGGLLYFDVDIDEAFIGVRVAAMLWLAVEPAHLDAAGRTLAGHPEIPFASATTGPTNLVASGVFRDNEHLYEYLTTRLPAIPGIRSIETSPVITTLKRTGPRNMLGARG